jgi:glycyl-tRNA synthetase beta chain
MVMAEDAQVRNNRLALLHSLRQLFINVADISQLAPAK